MSKAHGFHVMVDYTEFFPNTLELGKTMLKIMESAIDNSAAKRVHSHIEIFDGVTSPPGFAAVILLDESHFSAHCYSDKGWLAIDCFTCGGADAEAIVDEIDQQLKRLSPTIILEQRTTANRFLNRGE